jgi:UDP-2-acetamido-3-amino-2,3-dideoxy-glucuronate N-acetyltransferase
MSNLAVIGCGYWGRNLVRNFYELGALTHILDTDSDCLRLMMEQYPGVSTANDYEKLLKDDHLKAVVIATPAEQHFAMAEAALLAGKDVFVEKPIALRFSDGEKLIRLAEKLNRILMVGHLLEYHPAILKLKQIIDSGELGKIQYIYSNRLNLGRVRREENILWSFAPHDIAVILRLIGDLPLEATSTGGAYLQPNIADVTVTNMLFDNGVRAHIFVSWLHPYKEHRLVVIGAKKMASFNDGVAENKLLLYDRGMDWVNGALVPRKGDGTNVEFDTDEPLKIECQHFLECLRTRQSPRTDGKSALDVLRVLEASQRSLQTQGQPVQLKARALEIVAM